MGPGDRERQERSELHTDFVDTRSRQRPRDCRRLIRLLPALPDGDLCPADAAFVESHLASCHACRQGARAFTELAELVRQSCEPIPSLPTGEAVAASVLATADDPSPRFAGTRKAGGRCRAKIRPPMPALPRWPKVAFGLALAALFLLGVWVTGWWPLVPGRGQKALTASWRVDRLAGAPRCGPEAIHRRGRLRVGEWLVTDGASRARIDVANIGQVEVEPNTRIRLLRARSDEHRMGLARGAVRAQIQAPPHLFFVETPSAVAVDLGCAYTLAVDDMGRSILRVTTGWVALVREGREVIVPQGARCETRPGIGLGTPCLEDAPQALQTALAELDFAGGGSRALGVVLAAARQPDSFTLWHLLPRVSAAERDRVYNRLAALTPPPTGVTRDGVRRLDRQMLDRWREEIDSIFWSEELGGPIW